MKMLFMGRKIYAAELLEWTVNQGVEVVAVCTDNQFINSPTKKMADRLEIPVISMEEAEDMIRNNSEAFDVVVSYLYWRKIRKPLIDIPKLGCINFHPAILPSWRGTAGYNLAILNKLTEWGATAHYVNEEIDMGEIIKVYKFNFDYRLETALSLEKKTQSIQKDLYKNIILDVLQYGKLESSKQEFIEGIYVSRKQMEEMKEIKSDDDIDLKIRAFWFPPYNGAYINLNGKKYTLVSEDILKNLKEENTTFIV